jgi:predicted ATPase
LLRIKGELLLLQGGSGTAAATEDHYHQALGWARRQGALSWELRTATSLARLLRDQNRSSEAIALLAPIYNRFTEGFETADLKTAKALIDSLPLRAGARRCQRRRENASAGRSKTASRADGRTALAGRAEPVSGTANSAFQFDQ